MRIDHSSALSTRTRRLGFSLVEVALSIGLAGVALAFLEQGADDASRQVKDAAVADRIKEVYNAATAYVQANPGLVSSIPVGGSISLPVAKTSASGAIPVNSLQSGGYLPSTFVDSNAYHQSSAVIIRQPSAGNIEALVTTVGGDIISDVDLGRVAAKVGADGGVVDSTPPPGITAGTMLGVGGGWQEPASNWTTSGITPSAGHAVAVNYASQVNALQDFLYRNNIGIAEANRMHTAIDMTHNALNSVGTINNTDQTTGVDAPITISSILQGSGNGMVLMENGLFACEGNATGCRIRLSDDGGLEDLNDGWITVWAAANNPYGLHVSNANGDGGNFVVDGTSTLTGSVITGNGVQMQNGGTITWPGTNGTSSYLGPDNALAGYLEVYGSLHASTEMQAPTMYASNLSEGKIVQADSYAISPVYYDKTNSSYYLIPSGSSNLYSVYAQYLQSATSVQANPSGARNTTDFYAPGFQVWEDSTGATDETLNGALTVNGSETIGGNLSVNSSETVAGTAQANGLITTASATLGSGCGNNGEIARDASTGNQDWCKIGVWSPPAVQFANTIATGQGYFPGAWTTNTRTVPVLVTAYTINTCLDYGIALGGQVVDSAGQATVADGQGYNPTISFIVPPNASFALTVSSTPDGSHTGCALNDAIYYSAWY